MKNKRNEYVPTRKEFDLKTFFMRGGVKGSSLKESKSGVLSNPLKGNTASTINKSAGNDHLLTTSLLISSSLTTQNTDSTHCSSSSNLSSNTDSTSNTSNDSSSSCDSGGF